MNFTGLKVILSLNGNKSLLNLILLTLITSLSDTISIVAMFPVVLVITDPKALFENEILLNLLEIFESYIIFTQTELLLLVLTICGLIILITTCIKFKHSFTINNYLSGLQHKLNLSLLKGHLSKDYEFFISENSSNLTNTIIVQNDKFVNLFIRNYILIFSSATSLILIFSFLLYIDYSVALVSLIILAAIFLSLYKFIIKRVKAYGQECTKFARRLNLSVAEIYRGIKAIKLLPSRNHCVEKVETPSNLYRLSFFRVNLFQSIPLIITESFIYLIIIFSVILTIYFNKNFEATLFHLLPTFGIYVIAILRIKPHVSSIFAGVIQLKSSIASAEYVFSELLSFKSVDNPKLSNPLVFKKSINFKNLNFKYITSDKHVLHNLNFKINYESFIGITGATGCGKSTLMDILLGLLVPSNGCFLVDDTKIEISNLNAWQSMIGYVPQEIFLTDSTIAENIAFGQREETIDSDYLDYICKLCLIDEFTHDLPKGVFSSVGETGVCLSGGQRQRIGIARALYYRPSILVLDEATSALDVVTENKILKNLTENINEITLIMVTHRPSTLINCDQVLCLEKGQIRFDGNYQEFLASDIEINQVLEPN